MGQTEVNVFLVAMAILPFLQNMLLNIDAGHYIMYVYIIFRQKLRDKKKILSPFQKTTLAETLHYITYPKSYTKETPFMLKSHNMIIYCRFSVILPQSCCWNLKNYGGVHGQTFA